MTPLDSGGGYPVELVADDAVGARPEVAAPIFRRAEIEVKGEPSHGEKGLRLIWIEPEGHRLVCSPQRREHPLGSLVAPRVDPDALGTVLVALEDGLRRQRLVDPDSTSADAFPEALAVLEALVLPTTTPGRARNRRRGLDP